MTDVPDVLHEGLDNLERGGLVFLRDGAASEYLRYWIHVRGKKLYIYNKQLSQGFEEIDLLTVLGIRECTTSVNSSLVYPVLKIPDYFSKGFSKQRRTVTSVHWRAAHHSSSI